MKKETNTMNSNTNTTPATATMITGKRTRLSYANLFERRYGSINLIRVNNTYRGTITILAGIQRSRTG